MLKITRRKLIHLGDTLCISLPASFIKRFNLKKGDYIDLVVLHDTICLSVRNIKYTSEGIRADLDLLLKLKEGSEEMEGLKDWFGKLSPEEQEHTKKILKEFKDAIG
jgi:hypothetical protein